jgi:hypothetical protein
MHKILQSLSRRFIYERRAARRHPASVAAIMRIRSGNRFSSYVDVSTTDLSATGLSVECSMVRIDDLHVSDSADMVTSTKLDLELQLPGGPVTLVGETVRYDRLGASTYLLGVRIVELAPEAERAYTAFLEGLH